MKLIVQGLFSTTSHIYICRVCVCVVLCTFKSHIKLKGYSLTTKTYNIYIVKGS